VLSASFSLLLISYFWFMNNKKFTFILYLITMVIIGTIVIQVFWNYKNYQINKQQFINDVQISLDNATNSYFENLAKKMTTHLGPKSLFNNGHHEKTATESIISQINLDKNAPYKADTLNLEDIEVITIIDATKNNGSFIENEFSNNLDNVKDIIKNLSIDSILNQKIEALSTKMVLSMASDTFNLKKVDSFLKIELNRKKLDINYGLSLIKPYDSSQILNPKIIKEASLSTQTKSALLPKDRQLNIHFKNEKAVILKRILSGIVISTFLVLAVISCLFYMLKVINTQKQIAEIKNDLISNITHEFKTPIATISVALESIHHFNVMNDKTKTKRYLETSSNQLKKLTIMVEKLLETATLESEDLQLNKEKTNLIPLFKQLIEKHHLTTKKAAIKFNSLLNNIPVLIDPFHFENAINNVIDNAIKYGGNSIWIELQQHKKETIILISDSGNSLTQETKKRIFDKFYRVPKGNTHDVKGFGIGLFYTKQIIEKHQGHISVNLSDHTSFKITLPHA